MKILSLISIFSSITVLSGQAASVSLTNIGSGGLAEITAITYAGSSTPASGGIAAAGYFLTLSDAQVFALASDIGNIAALIADFQVVASTTLDSAFGGLVPNTGLFSLDAPSVSLPNATLSGKSLYSFLGDQATLGVSNQYLLWDHTDVIDVQDTITNPDSNSLVLGREGSALISGGLTTAIVNLSGVDGPSSQSVGAIRLAAVAIPEPSALLLTALGALALLRRKR
jgi:hypothetical protein